MEKTWTPQQHGALVQTQEESCTLHWTAVSGLKRRTSWAHEDNGRHQNVSTGCPV